MTTSLILVLTIIIIYFLNRSVGGEFGSNISRLLSEFISLSRIEVHARSMNALLLIAVMIIAGMDLLTGEIEHIGNLIAGAHGDVLTHAMPAFWAVLIVISGLLSIRMSR